MNYTSSSDENAPRQAVEDEKQDMSSSKESCKEKEWLKSSNHDSFSATTLNNENPRSYIILQEAPDDQVEKENPVKVGVTLEQEHTEGNQSDNASSLACVQQTILDEIDVEDSVLQTKKLDDVNNSEIVPETDQIKSDDTRTSSFHDIQTLGDKENTTFIDTIFSLSPNSENSKCKVINDDSASEQQQQQQQMDVFAPDPKPDVESVKAKATDPFSLSADEEFSPKVYKPIQRKLSMCHKEKPTLDLKRLACEIDNNDINDTNHMIAEDLSSKSDSLSDSFPGRKKLKSSHRVTYVHSPEMLEKANRLSRIKGRANLIHSLIQVYGILRYVDVLEPRYATEAEILGFHCPDYVRFLKGISDDDDDNSEAIIDEAEEYGLSYDCPLQKDCFDIASLISGGTIVAAEALCRDEADIAINWCGGWHHAKRDSASGFCYLNDIVLGILKLRERFDKVLYIDLDLHHGDGVQEAFYMTPKVMTVSFHKLAPGFFPGTGNMEDIGTGRGKFFSVNVPLMDGIKDNEFYFIFTSIMKSVKEKFQPEAVVIQCGADTLAEDPMLSFNLTHLAVAKCVCFALTWNLPALLLGGGGYHFASTAKCWTFITAMAAGKKLPVDIPEHECLPEYGPSYELTSLPGNRKNCNSKEYLRQMLVNVHRNLNRMDTKASSKP